MPESNDGSSNSKADDFDVEIDLLQRYEQMVQTQINTLNGIDDKAASIARLVTILVGLLLSAASLLVGRNQPLFSFNRFLLFLFIGLAVSALVVSLVFAIITYLSSRFEYGPKPDIGDYLVEHKVEKQQYIDVLLTGYGEAIRNNKKVVVTNARRFQKCLASLITGVIFTVAVGALVILPTSILIELTITIFSIIASAFVIIYIIQEEYLTLDRQLRIDE